MAISYSDIPESILEETDAEIAYILSCTTKGPVDVPSVRFWLKNTKPYPLLVKSELTGTVQGVLWNVMQDVNTPAEIVSGLTEFAEHVLDPTSKTVATHTPTWAKKAEDLLSALEASGVITHEQHVEFHDLDGGLKYPSAVTEQDVTDARAAKATQDAADAARAEVAAIINEHVNPAVNAETLAELLTALQAAVTATQVAIGG